MNTPASRPRPGTFSITGDGHDRPGLPMLVLSGANGEPVVWSETYGERTTARDALAVVVRTVLVAEYTSRGNRDLTEVASFDAHVEAITDRLLEDGS